jgi:hypothetical protein
MNQREQVALDSYKQQSYSYVKIMRFLCSTLYLKFKKFYCKDSELLLFLHAEDA